MTDKKIWTAGSCLLSAVFQVEASCLFQLLLSLETPSPDPLNIGELVKEEKPLKAIDFCYHDESEMVNVVDCISLCVMVVSFAADSLRAYQMLVKCKSSIYTHQSVSTNDIIGLLSDFIRKLI